MPAVVSGRVDAALGAYWTHETILAERLGYPVDLLRVEEWGVPPYYELVLTAAEKTVVDSPETVRAFPRAARRGYAEAATDREAALDALTIANPELDRAVEATGLDLLAPVWTEAGSAFGAQTPRRWRAYAQWMAGRGLIPNDLDPDAAFTAAFTDDPAPSASPVATGPSFEVGGDGPPT